MQARNEFGSMFAGEPPPGPSQPVLDQLQGVRDQLQLLSKQVDHLGDTIGGGVSGGHASMLDIFGGYIGVFATAFLVTLAVTPLMRRLAIANGIIDRPDEARKMHKVPIAYLGGLAVFLGILSGIVFTYAAPLHGLLGAHTTKYLGEVGLPQHVPLTIVIGMAIITVIGLLDDVANISPWQKVGGQLFAAALLAMENVGVKVAYQVLYPLGKTLGYGGEIAATTKWVLFSVPGPGGPYEFDLIYWAGTAIIALFVLGACNASNLIDGLDGLLTGVTAISTGGLLILSLSLAALDSGPLDGARIVLCLAVLGACLGFLPYNFNPAAIFLGDCGSLLLGFCTIVIVLTLGDRGQTNLVLAGLVIYAIPILDTALAIIRRKLSGKSIADADDQHLHHMFKRALGVKGAVFVMYGLATMFVVLGILLTFGKARITYAVVAVVALFICVTAIKIARRRALEEQIARLSAAPVSRTPDAPQPSRSTPEARQKASTS